MIIAPEREQRPDDYRKERHPHFPNETDDEYHPECPFCRGNEHMCLEPVYEIMQGKQWSLRCIPNVHSALEPTADPTRVKDGIHLKAGGYGCAEVLIETPAHHLDIASLPLTQVEEMIKAYRSRYIDLARDPMINTINIFRNHGVSAGASLRHPHSQIIACMVAPPHVTDQINYAKHSYSTWGDCIYCYMIREELRLGTRIVEETPYFVVLCPYASKWPYEVRIFPKNHRSSFALISSEEEMDLAYVLRRTLQRIRKHLNDPDYNYYIRSNTTSEEQVNYYHWYLSIIPRIHYSAGFELGTGIFINTFSPEVCAEELRAVSFPDLPPGLQRRL